MKNRSTAITLIVIAIAVVLILLVVSLTGDNDNDTDDTNTDDVTDEVERFITAQHQFENGQHIIAGEVELATPCDLLETEAVVNDNASPQEVVIRFTTVNESEDCAQVVTAQRFKVEFEAPENAEITATFNGAEARLNLLPVEAGEDLDDFEVFIKG